MRLFCFGEVCIAEHRSLRLAVALGLLLISGTLTAHDIGVTQAELQELEGGQYQFQATIGIRLAALHPSPELPEYCAFTENPQGIFSRGGRLWTFSCDDVLTANDTLSLPWRRDGAMVTARWLDGTVSTSLFTSEAGRILVPLAELQAGSGSWSRAAGRYTLLGVEHILIGVDHLLFVLGLLMLVGNRMMLVKTITAFTVAHSITLGLATLGFVSLPPKPVEAAIALSIVFLAVEILRGWQGHTSLTHRAPWIVAFGFGLLHGLGFAGALSEIGLAEGEVPLALLFFNVGVEIGQLLFVAVVLALLVLLRKLPVHRIIWVEALPVYAIGVTSAYWVIERVVAMNSF